MRILLTGSTGFLGQNIVAEAIRQKHQVMTLRHTEIDSCASRLEEFSPEILVHCAWGGVSAADRNNPELQKQNIDMSKKLARMAPYKQIIAIGSQDEYGYLDNIIREDHALSPLSEYAKAKIKVCNDYEAYTKEQGIEFQWIRLFNMYGPGQASNWVIPAVVEKCLSGAPSMQTTLGEQRYAYLYVGDFARAIVSMFGKKEKSGIYNLSASNPVALRDLFNLIKELTSSKIEFEYGALPYRKGQSMMICGDATKFKNAFGDFEKTDLRKGLEQTILNIKNQLFSKASS